METSASLQSQSPRYPMVASSLHTILMLVAMVGWTFGFKIFAEHTRAAVHPNRISVYLITMFVEWVFFALVVVGVRRRLRAKKPNSLKPPKGKAANLALRNLKSEI